MNNFIYYMIFPLICVIANTQAYNIIRNSKNDNHNLRNYQATVMGFADIGSGIGRLPIVIADMLYKDISINWIPTDDRYVKSSMQDMPVLLRNIFKIRDQRPSNVVLFTDMLWDMHRFPSRMIESSKAFIKIAYSMLESTAIPQEWVAILNKQFDAVVVPDAFLINVYKNSGVKIPIFVLPIPLYLEQFLENKHSEQDNYTKNKPFIFGNASALWPHKNHKTMIEAFVRAFGNSPKVKLCLNGRMARPELYQELKKLIQKLGVSNIELSVNKLTESDYRAFMRSFSCYINLSTGEGFSIPPYEALALGIPVILSDNTAQASLCKTGFVRPVACLQKIPAYYNIFGRACGYGFACTIDDAADAFKDIFKHKELYRIQANKGKSWVKKFLRSSLKNKYKTLFKPSRIQIGNENSIAADGTITTNDQRLFSKYKTLIARSHSNPKVSHKQRATPLVIKRIRRV